MGLPSADNSRSVPPYLWGSHFELFWLGARGGWNSIFWNLIYLKLERGTLWILLVSLG